MNKDLEIDDVIMKAVDLNDLDKITELLAGADSGDVREHLYKVALFRCAYTDDVEFFKKCQALGDDMNPDLAEIAQFSIASKSVDYLSDLDGVDCFVCEYLIEQSVKPTDVVPYLVEHLDHVRAMQPEVDLDKWMRHHLMNFDRYIQNHNELSVDFVEAALDIHPVTTNATLRTCVDFSTDAGDEVAALITRRGDFDRTNLVTAIEAGADINIIANTVHDMRTELRESGIGLNFTDKLSSGERNELKMRIDGVTSVLNYYANQPSNSNEVAPSPKP